jgi:hypothetical protein
MAVREFQRSKEGRRSNRYVNGIYCQTESSPGCGERQSATDRIFSPRVRCQRVHYGWWYIVADGSGPTDKRVTAICNNLDDVDTFLAEKKRRAGKVK